MSDAEVKILNRKMDQVLHYLHNDEGTGEKGLVAQVRQLQQDVTTMKNNNEKDKAIKRTTIGIWGTIGAAVLMLAKWSVEKWWELTHNH